MRVLFTIVMLTVLICVISVSLLAADMTQTNMSLKPHLYIQKNIAYLGDEARGEFYRDVVLYQSDFSIGGGVKFEYGSFFTNVDLIASWYDSKAKCQYGYDANLGVIIGRFNLYCGLLNGLNNINNNFDRDLVKSSYIGTKLNHNFRSLSIEHDFQLSMCSLNDNYTYSNLSISTQANYAINSFYPFVYASVNWFKLPDNDDLSVNIGVGISIGHSGVTKYSNPGHIPVSIRVLKPNIYLYPQQSCSVKVSIEPNRKVLTSIPPYNEGWHVLANPDGSIPGTEGFLFYEASVTTKIPEQGWVVAFNELSYFFDETLHKYGFNDTEIIDFIDYWPNRLPESPYYAIYPILNHDLNDVCPLEVVPTPDNELRLWFIFVPVDEPIDIESPSVPSFTRTGFVVTEWGGIIFDRK